MNELLGRTREVRHRLVDHLTVDLRCAAACPSRVAWQVVAVAGTFRYGWAPPTVVAAGPPPLLLYMLCPELIAETTLWLDDGELDIYLTTIEAFFDGWAAMPGEPVDDVYQVVQTRLYHDAAVALELMSTVELRALNDGVVTAG